MRANTYTTILFLLATSALLFLGNVLGGNLSITQIIVQQIAGLAGTYFIYQMGGLFFEKHSIKEIFTELSNDKIKLILVLLFFLVLPFLVLYFLPSYCFWVFTFVLVFGVLYSIPFLVNGKTIVLKKTLIVKNIFIGFSWGALILEGAAANSVKHSWELFLFVSLQIFIGSILRDFYDIEKDKAADFKTLPIVYGEQKSIRLLHFLNIAVLAGFLFYESNIYLILLYVAGTLYKSVLIRLVERKAQSVLFTQTLNIGFCYFIFFIVLIQRYGLPF